MTSTSLGTLVKGAKQLVVQEALETSTSPGDIESTARVFSCQKRGDKNPEVPDIKKGGRWVVEVEKTIFEVGS